ncbi:MAG: MBL fold metallo-hydrolase, partial [Propionibacteriaceae bacterium]|nr:MBL fold metallo-hydrolase [Propionibacteriaceae bacterium]
MPVYTRRGDGTERADCAPTLLPPPAARFHQARTCQLGGRLPTSGADMPKLLSMPTEIPAESAFSAVAEKVWLAVAEPESVNIGLIAGDDGALLVDTGSDPEQGARLRAGAEAAAGVPLIGVFVTHAHHDHVGGLPAVADLPSH